MIEVGRYNAALLKLQDSKKAFRCDELGALLVTLGFRVESSKTVGHKLVFHDGLSEFHSTSFNCDHSKNPVIKKPYISKVKRVLVQHKADLLKFLDEEQIDDKN